MLALAATILISAMLLSTAGFHAGTAYHGYFRSALFATEASISLLRPPTVSLTFGGQIAEIVLRLAGPLFFGLMLLSLRGRIKR
jgi:hypothetical protein